MRRRVFLGLLIVTLLLSCIIGYGEMKESKEEVKQKVIEILKKDFNVDVSEKENMKIILREEGYHEVWDIAFKKEDVSYEIEMDANTKRIVIFEEKKDEMEVEKITKQEARNIADNFVKKINEKEKKETRLVENNDGYTFEYKRSANQVDFDGNEILVEINKETGKVNYYRIRWNDTVSYEEMKKITKEIREYSVAYLKDYFNIEIGKGDILSLLRNKDEYDIYFWEIEKIPNAAIRMEIDKDNKKILNFNLSKNIEYKRTKKIEKKKAQKIADEFIKKMDSKESRNVGLQRIDENGEDTYCFIYVRKINGLDFDENRIIVEVDKEDGKINGYNIFWDDTVQFEDLEDTLDHNKAQEIVKNNMKVNLYYKGVAREDNIFGEKKLVYKVNNFLIDAKKGNILDLEGEREKERYKDVSKEEKEKILKSVPIMEKTNKGVTQEEGIKIMRERIKELVHGDVDLTFLGFTENDDSWGMKIKKGWVGTYGTKDSTINGDIIIDAENGKVIVFTKEEYNTNQEEENNITWEEGYDKAIQIIKKYYPDKIMHLDTKIEYDTFNERGSSYQYYFKRVENGLEYAEDDVLIILNKNDADIKLLECDWDENPVLPDKNKAMAKEKAKDIFFKNCDVKLHYETMGKDKDTAKLVYELIPLENKSERIDGINGNFLNYKGEEIGF